MERKENVVYSNFIKIKSEQIAGNPGDRLTVLHTTSVKYS